MNITVGDYTIKRQPTGQIFITKKGVVEAKFITNPPWTNDLENMSYEEVHLRMQIAFETGKWPTNRCPHCGK